MKDNHALMTNQSLTKQTRLLGTVHVAKKRRGLLCLQRKGLMRILNIR